MLCGQNVPSFFLGGRRHSKPLSLFCTTSAPTVESEDLERQFCPKRAEVAPPIGPSSKLNGETKVFGPLREALQTLVQTSEPTGYEGALHRSDNIPVGSYPDVAVLCWEYLSIHLLVKALAVCLPEK